MQPGLVNITTTLYGGGGQGAGTGMVISSSGEVLTNNHVIENAESISVEIGGDGESHSAKVIGYDVADDVALIKIEGVSDLDTIPIGDPERRRRRRSHRGARQRARPWRRPHRRPRARSPRSTARSPRPTPTARNAETLSNLIQVQADVQPGDSGGALVDSDGEVIGMTTAASSNGFRFQEETAGVGFAIRIDKALSIVKLIRNGEEVDGVHVGSRGLLGVSLQSELSLAPGGRSTPSTGDGAEVIDVTEDGPAADAGIETGDIIISLGDATITSSSDLSTEMDRYHAGDKVEVGLDRRLRQHPARDPQAHRGPARLTFVTANLRQLRWRATRPLVDAGWSVAARSGLAEDLVLVFADVGWAAGDAPRRLRRR